MSFVYRLPLTANQNAANPAQKIPISSAYVSPLPNWMQCCNFLMAKKSNYLISSLGLECKEAPTTKKNPLGLHITVLLDDGPNLTTPIPTQVDFSGTGIKGN